MANIRLACKNQKISNGREGIVKSLSAKSIYVISNNYILRKIDEEIILVPLKVRRARGKNEAEMVTFSDTGKDIVQRIDGKKTIGRIISELEDKYNCSEDQMKEDLREFFSELSDKKIIKKIK
jgi:hypothetical protein